jgi:hypothetical protein
VLEVTDEFAEDPGLIRVRDSAVLLLHHSFRQTSVINGAEEQERRATSALLAVMSAVREFGRAVTQPLGAPAGTLSTFIEVPSTSGISASIRTDL